MLLRISYHFQTVQVKLLVKYSMFVQEKKKKVLNYTITLFITETKRL